MFVMMVFMVVLTSTALMIVLMLMMFVCHNFSVFFHSACKGTANVLQPGCKHIGPLKKQTE